MTNARSRKLFDSLLLGAVVASSMPAMAGESIVQYFESRWQTIERRMPDVFMAGYDAIWVPPPGRRPLLIR